MWGKVGQGRGPEGRSLHLTERWEESGRTGAGDVVKNWRSVRHIQPKPCRQQLGSGTKKQEGLWVKICETENEGKPSERIGR